MKTNVMKRAMALILAALIVLGTLGYLWTVAFAVETTSGITDIEYEITSGTTPMTSNSGKNTIKVTFKTTDPTMQGNLEKDDNTVTLVENTSFTTEGGDARLTLSGSDGSYTVTLESIKYTGKGSELAFQINVNGITPIIVTKALRSSDFTEDGSSGPGPGDGDDDTPGGGATFRIDLPLLPAHGGDEGAAS